MYHNGTILVLSNSQILRNSADYGGGICIEYQSTAIISSSEVSENFAV